KADSPDCCNCRDMAKADGTIGNHSAPLGAGGSGVQIAPPRPMFPTRCGHFHQVAERHCSQVCSCVDPQNSTACGQIGNQAGSDSLIGVQEVTSQTSAARPNCSIVYERS